MNIAAIFSAFLGSKDPTKSDVAEVPGADFIGFVWESDVVDKFRDANAPWPGTSTIQSGTPDAQPDMPRNLTERAGSISEIGHFMQPKPAIQPKLAQAELPDQSVAVPAGEPIAVQAARSIASDDKATQPAGPDNSTTFKQSSATPSQDENATKASVDNSAPENPAQTQSGQSAGNSTPNTPDRQEFPPPRATDAPPDPPTVHAAAIKPEANKVATQPETHQQVIPAVQLERSDISPAVPDIQMAAERDDGNALPTIAKGAHPPQVKSQPAAPAPVSPRHAAFPQAPVPQSAEPQAPVPQSANPQASNPQSVEPQAAVPKAPSPQTAEQRAPVPQAPASSDTLPNSNPLVSKATESPPSPRIAQSPDTTEKPQPVPIHRTAETPVTRVQNHPETPPPSRLSRAYAHGQARDIASGPSAHRPMAERTAEPTIVSSHGGQATPRPIGQPAVARAPTQTGQGKPIDGFVRSEPIIPPAEHPLFHPPKGPQIVQHSLPAAPPPTTPLAPAPVAPGDTAATATKSEASPMPELTFAELATVPGSTVPENLLQIHPRNDHAPRVIQVIADAARALQDRPIEVTLNPEELGRVRLTLRSVDGSMSVSVAVERPETLDLLRRNIDLLASQLRELGYKDLSFSFASQGESFDRTKDHGSDHQMFAENDPVTPHEEPPQGLMRISVTDTGGIDIRL